MEEPVDRTVKQETSSSKIIQYRDQILEKNTKILKANYSAHGGTYYYQAWELLALDLL